MCDKIQLAEIGHRSATKGFCFFSNISTKESKTLLMHCGSLLRIAGMPHLHEARLGMQTRVNEYIFNNNADSLLLFDGEEYKLIVQCHRHFKVFCHAVVANNITGNDSKVTRNVSHSLPGPLPFSPPSRAVHNTHSNDIA